jgi:hypothetical protein
LRRPVLVFAFGLLLITSGLKAPDRPWYWLFIEVGPKGGLSLATFQLAVWFFAAIGIFGGLSIPLHRFPPLTTAFVVLLGLALGTKVLGASMSKSEVSQAKGAPPAPELQDLVTDPEGNPEFSRYQQVVVAAMGALVLVLTFADTMSIPDIPVELLYLVGASQTAYLLPKALTDKEMRESK